MFFNKCCVYKQLIEKNINRTVAICCYSYLIISVNKENKLRERFEVTSWNYLDKKYLKSILKKQLFCTIVKDLIIENIFFTARIAKKILLNLQKIRSFEIYNIDI